MIRTFIVAATAALTLGTATAQDFPNKNVTLIVPFAAGGPTDVVTRLLAEGLTKSLGQPVIVENVAGAGGTIAAAKVANAKPDGYTLLVHHPGITSAATLYRTLPYDTKTAFQPIGLISHTAMTIIAKPDFEPNTFQEAIDYIKKNKDKVTFGNAGLGAVSHLCGMLFQSMLGVQMTTVPYKGTGPVMNDLRGKQIDMSCDQATTTTSHIKTKGIKAYAVTTKTRIADLPDLPTADEAGLKGFDLSVWNGVFGPKGLPEPVLKKLTEALQAAIAEPKYIERLKDINTFPAAKNEATPAGLGQQFTVNLERWSPIIKAAGQYAD